MIKIRIGGWAGQGTVMAGVIIGDTLAIGQGLHVVQTRSYSAAVRSGTSFSDVIADGEPLDELTVGVPDYLLVMYQKTLDSWITMAKECGCLIVDSDQVKEIPETDKLIRIPASTIAESSGSAKAANIVLLGALAGVSDEVDYSALKESVIRIVPERYRKMNIEALEMGYETAKSRENLIIDS